MKVLVADSNESQLVRLTGELEKLGFSTVRAPTGKAAFDIMKGDDAPQVAFMTFNMSDMGGAEVCKGLRKRDSADATHTIQPYLILVIETNVPEHYTAGIDAGADDFLSDRWHPNDVNVKMRLAERNYDLQSALQSHIKELEKTLRRHNLLREVMSKMSPNEAKRRPTESEKVAEVQPGGATKLNFSDTLANIPVIGNLHTTIADVFTQLGCGQATASIPTGVTLSADLKHLVWTPMFLCEPEAWIDIKVELNDFSALRLYEEMLGVKPQSDDDLNDALGEMLNIVQGALKGAFAKADVPSKTLTLPRLLSAHGVRLPTTVTGNFEKCEVTIGADIKALFTIVIHESPVKQKSINDIVEYDILDKNFYAPKNKNLPVLHEGVILNSYYLNKLNSFRGQKDATALVIEPSRVGRRCMAVG